MTEETKKPSKKSRTIAKPLPLEKEKTKKIDEQMGKEKQEEVKTETPKLEEKLVEKQEEIKKESEKKEEKKESKKLEIKKKEEAVAYGRAIPISKKHAMYIGKFIKNKKIDEAIADLEKVIKLKKAIPFRGEIPHRKGMERGRYPVKASKYFINLLKSLKGNVITNQMEIEDTRICFVSPSWAARPLRRGGRKAKRTHIIIKAKELPIKNKESRN